MVERYSSLYEAVRAQPKLRVQGKSVFLNAGGIDSFSSSNEVVFALGRQILGVYADVEGAIALQDIDRLRVLDEQEGSGLYGFQGGNGVVVIIPVTRTAGL